MISTTVWPASWKARSFSSTTQCPRWMSGLVGSIPSLTRSGLPEASCSFGSVDAAPGGVRFRFSSLGPGAAADVACWNEPRPDRCRRIVVAPRSSPGRSVAVRLRESESRRRTCEAAGTAQRRRRAGRAGAVVCAPRRGQRPERATAGPTTASRRQAAGSASFAPCLRSMLARSWPPARLRLLGLRGDDGRRRRPARPREPRAVQTPRRTRSSTTTTARSSPR